MNDLDARYRRLVSAWIDHDDMRRNGASLVELAAAGDRLRAARLDMIRHRS